jgi:hypothetical protein
MQDPASLQLPYLLRDMLRFESGVAFGLRLQVRAITAGTLTIRGATREGMFTYKQILLGNSTLETYNFRLPDIPVIVSVLDETLNQQQGTCFASLSLTANGENIYRLATGFVYEAKGISYPQTANEDFGTTYGQVVTVQTTNPAAGAELSITVPDGQTWQVLAIRFQLVAAAAAASRRVHILYSISDGDSYEFYSNTDQIINETKNYNCMHFGSIQDETDSNEIQINLPNDIYLRAQDTIGTRTINLQAGDNFGIASILIKRYFTTAP